jgi:nicotinate-nucleotide adenylyltransferase
MGEELELEKVCLIPAALPPHKDTKPVTPFHHRLKMLQLATDDSPILEPLDLEGRRQGLSYSIETLKEFHRLYKSGLEIFFLIGTDAFLEIKTWKDYKWLFDYAHFVVIKRPGVYGEELEPFLFSVRVDFRRKGAEDVFLVPSGNAVIYKQATLMDISSTSIRAMVAAGKSIRFLVPEAVRTYILKRGLYRVHGDTG